LGRPSDDKGQRGELGAAENLRNFYFARDAKRAPRKELHDIMGEETIEGIGAHVEVKSHAKHSAYTYMEQAVAQKRHDHWPLVILKANRKKNHLYVIRDVDILDFVRGYLINREKLWKVTEPVSGRSRSLSTARITPKSGEVDTGKRSPSPDLGEQPSAGLPPTTSSSARLERWIGSSARLDVPTELGQESFSGPDAQRDAS
jgi:hypothetical protein